MEKEEREKLAEYLKTLAESLLEDEDVGVVTKKGRARELKVTASFSDSTTIVAIRIWAEKDGKFRQSEDYWPDVIHTD